jgi:ectoine hydroxylase-related dioxygenase (phytanoyl-CoA dioxygenase family)
MHDSPVTEDHVRFYRENGYIQFRNFFSQEEVSALAEALNQAVENKRERILGDKRPVAEDYARVFNQMVNLWRDYPAVKPYAFHQRLAESARRLAECQNIRLYHDHALIKPPGEKSRETNWHQDAPYWPMEPVGALSAWIAVDDVSLQNGCMQFIPGTHKYGRQEPIRLGVDGESIVEKMKQAGKQVGEPVLMDMPAGGVTFHHGCTFHYATPNHSSQPRRAFAIIYIPSYTHFTGGKDAAGAADEMEVGKPWAHPLHPILAGEEHPD